MHSVYPSLSKLKKIEMKRKSGECMYFENFMFYRMFVLLFILRDLRHIVQNRIIDNYYLFQGLHSLVYDDMPNLSLVSVYFVKFITI